LASARPGVGTFVTKTLSDGSIAAHQHLSQDLLRWYRKARAADLDLESIEAIFQQTVRSATQEEAI
jgi:GntR family transcriptional regulator